MKQTLLLLLLLVPVSQVSASVHYAYTAPSSPVGNQPWTGDLGLDFNVNSSILVTGLGAFDSNQNGFVGQPVYVALYSRIHDPSNPANDTDNDTVGNGGVPIAQLVFNSTAGTLVGNYRFESLTGAPVVLAPGSYTIVAQGFDLVKMNGNSNVGPFVVATDSASGALSFVGTGRYDSNSVGQAAFPALTSAVQGFPSVSSAVFGAGSLSYSVVPEPASCMLWSGLALSIAVLTSRRSRAKTENRG